MRFLLDTNIISELLSNPSGRAADRYLANLGACFTSVIVASELRYGIAKYPDRTGAVDARRFLDELPIAEFEPPADEFYGRVRAELERAGTPISANDMFIAAHALALDCALVTANEREFGRVAGLRIENWVA